MNKPAVTRIANILKNSKTFFLATTDGKRPFVRPFNAVVEYDDKVYFYTNNRTNAFKQIQTNAFIEICAMIGEGYDRWLRVSGKVEYDYREEVKKAMLDANPELRTMYSEDDKIFYVFYLSNMAASIHSTHSEVEEIC